MADIARLQGDLGEAKTHLAKAMRQGFDPETEYVAALVDMDDEKPTEELERRLARIVGKTSLLRAMYRQARILASVGKTAEATAVLDRLFEMNSNHLRGRDLAARIEEGKPIALILDKEAEPDETTAARAPDAGTGTATEAPAPKQPVPAEAPEKTPSQQGVKAGISAGVDNVESLLIQATKAQVGGKTSEAMSLFNRVLERSPNNIDALSGLGYCYLDKGNFGQAIATFRRAIGINPSFGPALLGLAETSKTSGQKDQALKYYKKYLEANPNGRQAGLAKRNIDELENEISQPKEAETPPSGEQEKPLPENTPGADTGQETSVVITPPSDEKP